MTKRWAVAALAVSVVITVVVVAVLAAGDDTNRNAAPRGRLAPLHAGICATRHAGARGDFAEARRLFANRAHAALHDLAATAATRDRMAAARLLEAKEAVERDLAEASPELVPDLDRLISATGTAAGQAAPPACPQREES